MSTTIRVVIVLLLIAAWWGVRAYRSGGITTGETQMPAVFQTTDLALGLGRAREESRLAVVKAGADWCGPCKHMDATTWQDGQLAQWLERNAVPVYMDIDAAASEASSLRIRSIPVTMVFYNGEEVARHVGYLDGPEMLSWLRGNDPRPPANP
ncbi:MAG: thioredoxin family protein [Phycisphaeraceae bacterium]|nr:thioredoxin family protein [Phycisphaeraceae bacterium]